MLKYSSIFLCLFYLNQARALPVINDTLPVSHAGGLRFLVLGDWGRNGSFHQKKVADAMGITAKRANSSFIITTGDNFYEHGVKDTSDPQWQTSFENVYTASSLQIPWFPVLGNHDYNFNPDAQVAYKGSAARWTMSARYYDTSLAVGTDSLLLVFMDTDPVEQEFLGRPYDSLRRPEGAVEKQLLWLNQALAGSKARWKIVVGHNPLHTGGARRHSSRTRKMRNILEPVFSKYSIDLYLSGHEHHLEYLKPPGTTHYVISGAGSEARHVGKLKRYRRFAARKTGFVAISLTGNVLELEFIDGNGHTLYQYDIRK